MRTRIPIKDHHREIQLINRRVISALVIMSLLVLVLIARLAYLQFAKHDLYTTLSKKNWLDMVPVEPTRGLIYDRNGVLLAENIPVFSLDIIPFKTENIPQTLSEITKIIPLTDTELSQFQKQLKQHRRFDEIPLKLRLTEEEVARFAENQYRFPGALVKARLIRHYPFGGSFTHILGYVGRINLQELKSIDATNYSATNYIGKLGIEKFYEEGLHGKVGYEQVENDSSGETIRILNKIKPMPGKSLYLTIDSKLQLATEEALQGVRGVVVVIQPNTGQILAMVSMPTYDANIFVNGISNQDFQALQQSPDRPLYNRALRGVYPLASTIKPYFALEGLSTGTITPDYSIFDQGWFKVRNSEHIFRDLRKRGHGNVNLFRAITVSCDTYFYQLADKLGIRRIMSILAQFGFGELTGVDSHEELQGLVASPEWKKRTKGVSWYPGDTINSSIGQGFMLATPLQMASAIATIATRGMRYTPSFLLGTQESGKHYVAAKPQLANTVVMEDAQWRLVIKAMEEVVEGQEGTARKRFGPNIAYTVAGKTGTAQVKARKHTANEADHEDQTKIPEKLRDHSLFVAFAPVDKPKIAIAVLVENTNLAVGIARKVLDAYLAPTPKIPSTVSNTENIGTNTNVH